ncbi:hypothetical protein FZEAL_7480 [Fusarium zealandicum]|uniref:D-aminopeptidase n=1 Tax=Fusarium zealandicum TaxID=1053134 RepID=A0A8H4UFN7_9HYPO|nr:hypothetical protein FZEAL_7480 [Fusarium zealandicum]
MSQPTAHNGRARLRDILPQLQLGRWPTGPLNSITDVPGVLVHTQSISPDANINTGVTTILPRSDWAKYSSHAGIFSFNGCGVMTGSQWIEETGLLTSPIILTSSSAIGDAYRGVLDYAVRYHTNDEGEMDLFTLPVVAETYDGYLSDQSSFAVAPEHIVTGILNANSESVPEGNTGGGTGMICHRFKGGTGSSSRAVQGFDVDGAPKEYTVGVLVQANYGSPENLHIGGVPVGRIIKSQQTAEEARPSRGEDIPAREPRKDGSIIIIIATDVPLLPIQLQRVAKRATVGLAKVGGYGNNSSGDIFLAFSTAAKIGSPDFSIGNGPVMDPYRPLPRGVEMLDNDSINGVFEAAADATEEAIYNAICMAESTTGFKGRIVEALDLEKVKDIVGKRI